MVTAAARVAAAAVAPVQSLAQELPYAMGAAKKKKKSLIGNGHGWSYLGNNGFCILAHCKMPASLF